MTWGTESQNAIFLSPKRKHTVWVKPKKKKKKQKEEEKKKLKNMLKFY